jgi:hypothetical protein
MVISVIEKGLRILCGFVSSMKPTTHFVHRHFARRDKIYKKGTLLSLFLQGH